MQLPTTCMGTNQVQVDAVQDRPRPSAWYNGVGKRPIINYAAQRLMQGKTCIYTCKRRFCSLETLEAADTLRDKQRAIKSNNKRRKICATKETFLGNFLTLKNFRECLPLRKRYANNYILVTPN